MLPEVVSEVSGCLLFRNWVLNTRGKWIDSHHACYCFYSDVVCVVYTPSTRMCIDVFINQNQWIFGDMGYTTNYQLNIIPAYHWISWLNVFNVRSFHKPNREHSIWVLFLMKDFDRAYSHPPFILKHLPETMVDARDETTCIYLRGYLHLFTGCLVNCGNGFLYSLVWDSTVHAPRNTKQGWSQVWAETNKLPFGYSPPHLLEQEMILNDHKSSI